VEPGAHSRTGAAVEAQRAENFFMGEEKGMNPSRNALLTVAGVVLFMSGLHIVTYLTQASDIWWTPKELSPSLSDVAGRVEVYVREERIDDQIRSGRLQLLVGTAPTPVTSSDVRFRFNNWDRVRAQKIPGLLTSAALVGASCVGLLLALLGWMPATKSRSGA
jgi:hypothetical protein